MADVWQEARLIMAGSAAGPLSRAPSVAPRRHAAMSLSASELYEAGLALPPSVRKDIALRLLDSIEVADQESVDAAWTAEIGSRVDDIVNGKVEMIPGGRVFAELAERRTARQAARNA